jgi:phosphatidylglycerophosphate synthase
MDGSIARACDKKSKLGAFLDSASDIVFMIVVVLTVLYIMTQKYGLFDWKTGVTAVALSVTTFVLSIGTDYIHHDDFESNPVINLVHDNTTVLFVVVGGFMWWLVNRA